MVVKQPERTEEFVAEEFFNHDLSTLLGYGVSNLEFKKKQREMQVEGEYEQQTIVEMQEQTKLMLLVLRNSALINGND